VKIQASATLLFTSLFAAAYALAIHAIPALPQLVDNAFAADNTATEDKNQTADNTVGNQDSEASRKAVEAEALAKTIKTGRAKAQGCTRCHGREGMQQFARRASWEQSVSTFVIKQLLLFRGNRRSHEIMNAIAKPLRDQDIYEIAIWYESVSKK